MSFADATKNVGRSRFLVILGTFLPTRSANLREIGVSQDHPAVPFLVKDGEAGRDRLDSLVPDRLFGRDRIGGHDHIAIARGLQIAGRGAHLVLWQGSEIARFVIALPIGAEDLKPRGQTLIDPRRIAREKGVEEAVDGALRLR
ncbi:MAG: hypothetical protein RJA15_1181, partial [Actinomycetota bacterium]